MSKAMGKPSRHVNPSLLPFLGEELSIPLEPLEERRVRGQEGGVVQLHCNLGHSPAAETRQGKAGHHDHCLHNFVAQERGHNCRNFLQKARLVGWLVVGMPLPTTHSVSLRFDPPLVDGEPGQEEGQLQEESEDDANSGEDAVGTQGGQDGGSPDEEDDDVGRTGHGDPNSCVPHCSSDSLWQRNAWLLRLILPGVDKDKHVVNTETNKEAEYERMHRAVVEAEGRAKTKRSEKCKDGARDANRCQCCALFYTVPLTQDRLKCVKVSINELCHSYNGRREQLSFLHF